ncbi:MAG: hypothetical protein ACYC64_02845 [Armatimonadota bacterium]
MRLLTLTLAFFALIALAHRVDCADCGVTSPPTYDIGCPIPCKRVAVMNLQVTGDYSEQVQEWLPALIEDRLLAEGWTLVVRGQRMEHIQQECSLPGIKPETILPKQELLGATAFLEMNARIQVKDIQGLIGYKYFTFGDWARASVDLNGQIVDPATGVLKSSISVGASASGLKTALVAVVGSDWKIGAEGYNLKGIKESLVGKAADAAACRLLTKLRSLYPSIPGQRSSSAAAPLQPASTTVTADNSAASILITLPKGSNGSVGDRYGIYRGDVQVAEVEIVRVEGTRAQATIVSQSDAIKPSDVARKIPTVLQAK